MNHSTKAPTKSEAARFAKLKALGCVACKLDGLTDDQAEPQIHHFLAGTKRIGHMATVPLCYWHHNGLPYDGIPTAWLLANVGPSFHKHTRQFRQRYGSDAELLATVNAMIEGETA
jgi:hypothetical protein